jgi:hypothetical protein
VHSLQTLRKYHCVVEIACVEAVSGRRGKQRAQQSRASFFLRRDMVPALRCLHVSPATKPTVGVQGRSAVAGRRQRAKKIAERAAAHDGSLFERRDGAAESRRTTP